MINKDIAVLLGMIILAGCTSTHSGTEDKNHGSESTISSESISQSQFFEQISILISETAESGDRIAVYPFHDSDEIHPLSDYLVEGITAELSLTENVEVINRAAIDLIIEEQKIQLSGLIDEASTIEIGQQLGATVIVTGFIENKNLILQIIDAESAENLGGRQLTIPDELLAYLNEKLVIKQEFTIQEKGSFSITIMEDFKDSRIFSAITAETYGWGEMFLDSYTAIRPIEDGIGFTGIAELNDPELEGESVFELRLPMNYFTDESDGIYLKMKTSEQGVYGFGIGENFIHHYISTSTPSEYLIPWSFFPQKEPDFFKISVSSDENSELFRQDTTELNIELFEFGTYTRKNEADKKIISFEDEELNAVSITKLYGYETYIDYSEEDQGVPRINEGLDSFSYSASITPEGAVGQALTYEFTLTGLSTEIEALYKNEQDLIIYIDLMFTLPESLSNTIQFWLRSDIIREGNTSLYYENEEGEYAGYQDLRLNPLWSLQTMELDRTVSKGTYRMVLALEIPERRVIEALETGELKLNLGIDEISVVE